VIAFEMRAAHTYVVGTELEHSTSPVGRFRIVAREKAPDGAVVRVPLASSDEDLRSCKHWAQTQGL
jgi:hypothetical protein